MESFALSWSRLQLTFAEGIKQQNVDEETLVQAHIVASRVKTMTELLLDSMSLQNDLAPLLADLSINAQSSSPLHPTFSKPG